MDFKSFYKRTLRHPSIFPFIYAYGCIFLILIFSLASFAADQSQDSSRHRDAPDCASELTDSRLSPGHKKALRQFSSLANSQLPDLEFDTRVYFSPKTTLRPATFNDHLLILIPGGDWSLSSKTLQTLGENLNQVGFDVIYVDPPGTGQSNSINVVGPPTAEERDRIYAGVLHSILKALLADPHTQERPLVLVGHSSGGLAVSDLIWVSGNAGFGTVLEGGGHSFLDIVGMVSISAALTPSSRGHLEEVISEYRSHNEPFRRALQEYNLSPSRAALRKLLIEYMPLCLVPEALQNEQILDLIRHDLLSGGNRNIIRRAMHIDESSPLFAAHMEMLRDSTIKLSIVGDSDRLLPVDKAAQDASLIGAKLHILEGTGHFPFMDRPRDVARIIRDAIEQQEIDSKAPAQHPNPRRRFPR